MRLVDLRSRILVGDCLDSLKTLPAASVQCCVTSPPYWGLRDYGQDGQHGIEETPAAYVENLVRVFAAVRRVLRDDGTLWLNLGDSYAGAGLGGGTKNQGLCKSNKRHAGSSRRGSRLLRGGLKPKDLVGIPWRVALALQADGWYLRSDIIWCKPAPMPESVRDRPTKGHEYVFLLAKSRRYFYDADAIKLNGASRRTVWTLPSQPYKGAHFATMPLELARLCVLAGSSQGSTVLDPYAGAGTTGVAAAQLKRNFVGCELNPDYAAIAERRLRDDAPLFANVEVGT